MSGTAERRVIVVLLVVILAAVAAVFANRVFYGTFAPWADPVRLHWCGREYQPDRDLVTRSDVAATPRDLTGDSDDALVTVMRVPPVVGRPVVAAPTSVTNHDRLHEPCALELYLRTSAGHYRPYVISGGS